MQQWSPWSRFKVSILSALLLAGTLAPAGCGGKQSTSEKPLENRSDGPAESKPDPDAHTGDPGKGSIDIACDFENGWVAIIPQDVYADNKDEFLMQALIGFSVEPDFWKTLEEYKKFEAHAARKCAAEATVTDLEPGTYVMLVGWAGQFEKTGYKNNGRIETITIEANKKLKKRIATSDLDKDMPCISCPFLLIKDGEQFAELGQILIDRYIASKQGTDARETRARVEDGLITVKLAEREPEVSYIDSIEVWYQGKPLQPHAGVATALHSADGAFHILRMGDSITASFHAPIQDGTLPVEIRVNGYYILNRSR